QRVLTAQVPAPWGGLVAAHLLVLLMLWLLSWLRNVLPELEVRGEGVAVRSFSRWIVVPWAYVTAGNVTELSEASQIVLVPAGGALPDSARLSSVLYDGRCSPGILITSALSNFEQILQRVVLEVTRTQTERAMSADEPILQSDARSNLLLLSFRSGAALDKL